MTYHDDYAVPTAEQIESFRLELAMFDADRRAQMMEAASGIMANADIELSALEFLGDGDPARVHHLTVAREQAAAILDLENLLTNDGLGAFTLEERLLLMMKANWESMRPSIAFLAGVEVGEG